MSRRQRGKKSAPPEQAAPSPRRSGGTQSSPGTLTAARTEITQSEFSGPLPAPEHLLAYDKIVPGAAERILQMAENEARHRHSLEATAVQETVAERRRGQWMGFIIALLGLGSAVIAALHGDTVTASTIGGTTLVGIVAVFVVGRVVGDKDKE